MRQRSHRPNILFVILFFSTLGMISLVLSRPRGPHGGVVKKADNYFIEIKTFEKDFTAYLLTQKLRSVDTKEVAGEVKFYFPDSTDVNIPLKPKDDGFVCIAPGGFSSCKVSFTSVGKTVTARFEKQTQLVYKK
jgi:hypothetical protein